MHRGIAMTSLFVFLVISGGFNVAGEVRRHRLWLEYSHEMDLTLNNQTRGADASGCRPFCFCSCRLLGRLLGVASGAEEIDGLVSLSASLTPHPDGDAPKLSQTG